MGLYDEMEAHSFDSFDPNEFDPDSFDDANSFDPEYFDEPDNYRGMRKPRVPAAGSAGSRLVGSKMETATFDINVVSQFANPFNVELFYPQYSNSELVNANLNNSQPLFTGAGFVDNVALGSPVANVTTIIGSVANVDAGHDVSVNFWDTNGDLVYMQSTAGVKKFLRISCSQVPYRSLMKWLLGNAFRVEKTRYTVTNNAQYNNTIKHKTRTWLGAEKKNDINPRTFFRPDQFQPTVIDIAQPFRIDASKGLEFAVNGGETLQMSMFVSRYTKQAL